MHTPKPFNNENNQYPSFHQSSLSPHCTMPIAGLHKIPSARLSSSSLPVQQLANTETPSQLQNEIPSSESVTQEMRVAGKALLYIDRLQRAFGKRENDILSSGIHQQAMQGVQGAGKTLPYIDRLQRAFGKHDLSHVRAYTGPQAANAAKAIGAKAYATGNKIAFTDTNPDLYTVAHEVTHVVQQRAGVQLKSNIGQAGDIYEQQADKVANLIVQRRSPTNLLKTYSPINIQNINPLLPIQMVKLDYLGVDTNDPNFFKIIEGGFFDITAFYNAQGCRIKNSASI